MPTKSNEKPRLQIVEESDCSPDEPLSLAEIAKLAAAEVREEQRITSRKISRFSELCNELAEFDKVIAPLRGEIREKIFKKIQPSRDKVLEDRDDLLNDPLVLIELSKQKEEKEIANIDALTEQVKRISNWQELAKLALQAERRGWVCELPRNQNNRISFHKVKFPEVNNKKLEYSLLQLKNAFKAQPSKIVKKKKSSKKHSDEGFSNNPVLNKEEKSDK